MGKFSQISNQVEEADSYDVRQNLKTWHKEENTDEYCVVFRVEKAMKACKLNEDTQGLVRGADICVSCESKSTRPHLGDRCSGHGVESRMTRFKNVITPGVTESGSRRVFMTSVPVRPALISYLSNDSLRSKKMSTYLCSFRSYLKLKDN